MAGYTEEIAKAAERKKRAQELWKHTTVRRNTRQQLDDVLRSMAPGREYCMFCGDSAGTAIDHFEPVSRNPLRTFDWLNHLLACTHCNSHFKRDQFPVDEQGCPLLIDPTAEDPFDHLELSFSTGEYMSETAKGTATINVCGLNERRLPEGRMWVAYDLQLHLREWLRADGRLDEREKTNLIHLIWNRPMVDVCQAMLRQAHSDGLKLVLGSEFVDLLRRPDLREALLASPPPTGIPAPRLEGGISFVI
ncbi:HNH endonuclease family protein [Actinocorallia lasiicapitis]